MKVNNSMNRLKYPNISVLKMMFFRLDRFRSLLAFQRLQKSTLLWLK